MEVLGTFPDHVFGYGLGQGGQFALAALTRLVAEAGQALGLPTVKPMVNRDAANRKDCRQLRDSVSFGRKQQALASATGHRVGIRCMDVFQLSRFIGC